MTKKKKVGRREAEEPRKIVKQVRWTEREWEQVTSAAKEAGLAPSVLIRLFVLQNTKPEVRRKSLWPFTGV